ncbi:putative membrane protein [Peribacillus simplex]|uniref:hypothetical protein n=1 Tax=Peribacillus simplex TaxID=1478 RepID=UPI0024E250B7|nr:hypothetical protein [Peribacillus simplex]MDF9760466.1 putative membrane protein [Peribacillus simplex]
MDQRPEENNILYSLPAHAGDKISFFGSMIVNIGNILTILGIALEAQEVAQIEEEAEKELTNNPKNTSTSEAESESNAGFILALVGAIIVTIGDLVASGGVALEIEQSALVEKQAEKEAKEQSRKIRKMEKQINSLQQDMESLISITESLKREVIFLQNYVYPNFHQQ